MNLVKRLIAPFNRHLFGTGFICFLHHHFYKLRLIKLRADNDLLPLLNMNAAVYNQLCIFPKNCLFHTL